MRAQFPCEKYSLLLVLPTLLRCAEQLVGGMWLGEQHPGFSEGIKEAHIKKTAHELLGTSYLQTLPTGPWAPPMHHIPQPHTPPPHGWLSVHAPKDRENEHL